MKEEPQLASVGIELSHGQAAFCVAVPEWRQNGLHFVARHLERLPHRVRYARIAERLKAVLENLRAKGSFSVCIYVNSTNVGLPVVELIRHRVAASGIVPIEFNHGGRAPLDRDGVTVLGKTWLVSRLQAFIEDGRLHLPSDGPNTTILVQELRDYTLRPEPNADDLYGAFTVGTQDDLVNAIGLAIHKDHPRPWTSADWDALEESIPKIAGADEVEAVFDSLLGKYGDGDFF